MRVIESRDSPWKFGRSDICSYLLHPSPPNHEERHVIRHVDGAEHHGRHSFTFVDVLAVRDCSSAIDRGVCLRKSLLINIIMVLTGP